MNKKKLYEFINQHKLAVIATLNGDNKPESALIGIAISKDLEIVFDTVKTSRKYKNLLQHPNVALVIGWDNEITLQYEGIAIELKGEDASHYKEIYFRVYPDGRLRAETWPDIAHFKINPRWIRYSNFNEPVVIEAIKLSN